MADPHGLLDGNANAPAVMCVFLKKKGWLGFWGFENQGECINSFPMQVLKFFDKLWPKG